ncbi:MAG: hypothetical protein MK106_04875 [Mariniblastus sp.]|nr:hypothetical protein [Mariniblastus sp.]
MDFEQELKKAIDRGEERSSQRKGDQQQKKLSREELKNRHNEYRLNLSDHIEKSLKKLIEHFPGFEYETLYGDRGWGGAIARDDITRSAAGKSGSFFSRLELTVRPLNEFNVVNISGKGTIQNKEIFNWNHFKDIPETDGDEFTKKIDTWILQYAEQFAAR